MSSRVRLVGVVFEQARELLHAQVREQARRRLAARRVHPHVERAGFLVGEPAVGVVELHRRDAEVGEDHVRAGEPSSAASTCGRPAKLLRCATNESGVESGRSQTRFRARQLERIDVEPDQPSARLNALEDRARVAAEAERAVDRDVARRAAPARAAPRRP